MVLHNGLLIIMWGVTSLADHTGTHYGAFMNLASHLREKKRISKVLDILRAKTDKNVFKLMF